MKMERRRRQMNGCNQNVALTGTDSESLSLLTSRQLNQLMQPTVFCMNVRKCPERAEKRKKGANELKGRRNYKQQWKDMS
jgi:hypothetical protein